MSALALFGLGALSDLSPPCDLKGGIGESDNRELDDVSVSLRAVRSDRLCVRAASRAILKNDENVAPRNYGCNCIVQASDDPVTASR
jgi:hypothetical protein